MLKRWKQLTSKTLFTNPWWVYKQDEFEIPGGINGEYHFVHTNGSSMIVPITDDGKIILVNQYRYLCDKESLELPCGGVKTGHTYDEMAMIELEEETGYRSEHLEYIAEFNPFNGVTDEMCKVYIAKDLVKTQSSPDSTEEFELRLCSPDEFDALIQNNSIWDGMTIAAWTFVRSKI